MKDLTFSVVIPTRERPDTLEACIKSVLGNSSESLQLIVQDNASDKKTKQVCEKFSDPRLIYARSDVRVSMRQNFELGLRRADGQYVIFLGDDDALTLDSIKTLNELLTREHAEFVSWPSDKYMWPSVCSDGRGYLSIRNSKSSGGYYHLDLPDLRNRIADATLKPIDKIGHIYGGCVSRDLISRVMSMGSGEYFVHICPDYGAAMANIFEARSGLFVNRTLSLAGKSANSNGAAFAGDFGAKKSEAVSFLSENAKDKNALGELSGSIHSSYYCVYSTLKSAEVQLNRSFGLNKNRWTRSVIEQLTEEKRNSRDEIDNLLRDPDFKEIANAIDVIAPNQWKTPKSSFKGVRTKNIHVRTLGADKNDDVYVAALTFQKLLGNQPPLRKMSKTVEFLAWLRTIVSAFWINLKTDIVRKI